MGRINSWWSSISYLPNWGQPLRYFMSGTIGMTAGILFGNDKPRIVWENIDTAYAAQDQNKIAISASMFSEIPSQRLNPSASKSFTMEACLGFLAHEMAHFVWSPAKITGLLNPGVKMNQLAATVANIVEDVFIEDALPKRDKSFGWMISAAWDYLFTDEHIAKCMAAWDGVSLVELGPVTNVMACWKNQNFAFGFRSDFEEELYEKLMSVKGLYNLQDRKDLIEEIYNFLLDARKEETGEDVQEMEDDSEEFEKLMEELKKLLKEMSMDNLQPAPDGTMVEVTIDHSLKTGEETNALFMDRYFKFSDFSVDGKVIVAWAPVKKGVGGKLTFDKKWKEFAKFAADQGTVRRIRGAAGISGRLTHPANLYDTGKVYSRATLIAPNGSVNTNGAPQDIILVDLSGSMGGGMRGSGFTCKLDAACRSAQGAMEGLLAAKHRVAVYGHTTGHMGTDGETCVIREVKRFEDNVDFASTALYNIVENGAESSNADSYAVKAVAGKFKRDGSPMRLWVISDGQPACSLYAGDSGIRETKKVVDKLRQEGIEVYSFSIDLSAMSANNEIYGHKNNFNAQDVDVVRQVMKRFV